MFAQKKTADEISAWNAAWNAASREYSKLKTRVENLMAVYDGIKEKKKLPSIKKMTVEEEKATIHRLLKNYLTDKDSSLSANELIDKYRTELNALCTFDKDTIESFGHVNTWWVFGEVAPQLNYNVFMAEVDNVGYKRTKRGEKVMPNELFTLEYAPHKLKISAIDEEYTRRLADMQELIDRETFKKDKENRTDKITQFEDKIRTFEAAKNDIDMEYAEIKAFIDTYYSRGTLKDEYSERTDNTLISEFKNGRLQAYRSEYVALHEKTHQNVLDYMREIHWD